MACVLLCFAFLLMVGMVSCAPIVHISKSTFVGVDSIAFQTGTPYHAYYGIPFAEPPVGYLRFRAPVRYDNTKEPGRTFDDKTFKPGCIQHDEYFQNITIDEDCLFLNVFTPHVGPSNVVDTISLKKVIVHVHGGAFREGRAEIAPLANLVTDFDVIAVTIQYRLGLFGFLSHGDKELPGNFGLLDQIAALQWVKDNIRSFGGDPNDVTVNGGSAGSVSLSLLSISPLTKGLFTKVILESGTALSPWAIDRDYKKRFYKLAQKANCLPFSKHKRTPSVIRIRKIVDCLRKIEARELDDLMVSENVPRPEQAVSLISIIFFAPVVDGVVLPKDPSELMKDAEYLAEVGTLDRKYMVGFSNNEGLQQVLANYKTLHVAPPDAFTNPDSPEAQAVIKYNLRYFFSSPITKEAIPLATFMYYYPRDADGISDLQSVVDFLSVIDFVVPTVEFARALYAASNAVKVYLFVFDFYPTLSDPDFPLQGSGHSMSTAFVYDNNNTFYDWFSYANIPMETRNCLSNIQRGFVVNMATNGDPSLPDRVQWPTYTRTKEHYMSISEKPEVRQHTFAKQVALWLDFLPQFLVRIPHLVP